MTRFFLTVICLALGLARIPAAVFYVDLNSPIPPRPIPIGPPPPRTFKAPLTPRPMAT